MEWDNKNEYDAFYPYMQDAVFVSVTADSIRNQVFVSAYKLSNEIRPNNFWRNLENVKNEDTLIKKLNVDWDISNA